MNRLYTLMLRSMSDGAFPFVLVRSFFARGWDCVGFNILDPPVGNFKANRIS